MKKGLVLFALLVSALCICQPVIEIKLDRADATYVCETEAVFTVTIKADKDKPDLLSDGTATVRLTNDGLDNINSHQLDLSHGNPFEIKGTLEKPGFLSLQVSFPGAKTKIYAAAFEPLKIKPAADIPEDFESFWHGEIAKAEESPLDLQMTPWEGAPADFIAHKVSFAAPNGRVYGFISRPKAEGQYPAIFSVPGAGPGFSVPQYRKGYVTMVMNVHTYDPAIPGKTIKESYDDVNYGGMYMYKNIPDRTKTYMHRAIIGINRSLNWLAEQSYVAKGKIGYYGSSQGGAFGLILGGLNKNLRAIASNVPAMCDHLGYREGRLAGWPQYCRQMKNAPEIESMAQYYDAANFARFIDVPIRVIVGFADRTCSPSSVYAAYNVIPSKSKLIVDEIGMGHECWPSYNKAINWMIDLIQ